MKRIALYAVLFLACPLQAAAAAGPTPVNWNLTKDQIASSCKSAIGQAQTAQKPANRAGSPAATETKSHPATAAAKPDTQNDPKKKTAAAQPARDLNGASVSERALIQFDLAWIGAYNGLITGEANDKTVAAIKAFQKDLRARCDEAPEPATLHAVDSYDLFT